MEEKMSFPEQFLGSIFRIETYRYFYRRSLGRAILYIFLASIILAGVGAIPFLVEFNRGIDEMVEDLKNNMPDFELRDGELYVDAPMPLIVSESSDNIIIIDTSGQSDPSVLDGYNNGILLTRHDFYQRQNRFETRHFDLSAFASMIITKDDLVSWLPLLKWLTLFIIIFGFTFYFCGKLLGALIVAIGGLILESATGCKVGFGRLYALSLYALTLPMLIQTILNLVGVRIPLFFIIYYGLALFYLYRALTTICRKPEENPYTN